MKKLLLSIFCFMMLIGNVFAVSSSDKKVDLADYETSNYLKILESEGIEKKFKEYKENDKQATIYMFRGSGCGYCKAFLEFLNSITDEYGEYFKVVGFEVWGDKKNSDLLDSISAFLNSPAGGVPYIIIGEEVFPGYAESYNDSIKAAIKKEYEADEKTNVFDNYNAAIDRAIKLENGNAPTIIFWNSVILAIGVIIVIYYVKNQNKKIFERLDELNKAIKKK